MIMTSCCLFSCSGCSVGKMYTLKEAYEEGILTNEDLQEISNLYSIRYIKPDVVEVTPSKLPLFTQNQIKKRKNPS